MVKSPAGYRTGHFPEIRPDTGPDLLSGTLLIQSIVENLGMRENTERTGAFTP